MNLLLLFTTGSATDALNLNYGVTRESEKNQNQGFALYMPSNSDLYSIDDQEFNSNNAYVPYHEDSLKLAIVPETSDNQKEDPHQDKNTVDCKIIVLQPKTRFTEFLCFQTSKDFLGAYKDLMEYDFPTCLAKFIAGAIATFTSPIPGFLGAGTFGTITVITKNKICGAIGVVGAIYCLGTSIRHCRAIKFARKEEWSQLKQQEFAKHF